MPKKIVIRECFFKNNLVMILLPAKTRTYIRKKYIK